MKILGEVEGRDGECGGVEELTRRERDLVIWSCLERRLLLSPSPDSYHHHHGVLKFPSFRPKTLSGPHRIIPWCNQRSCPQITHHRSCNGRRLARRQGTRGGQLCLHRRPSCPSLTHGNTTNVELFFVSKNCGQ